MMCSFIHMTIKQLICMKHLQPLSDTNASLSIFVQSILAEIRNKNPDIDEV